jgi:hypothetical protein
MRYHAYLQWVRMASRNFSRTALKGHNRPYEQQEKHDYTSGDYECTKGDEHNAPDCRTSVEWAELERIGGTPDMVLFTMADGVQIGVQSVSVNKVYEITCSPGVSIIFCDVYYKLMEMTQANFLKTDKYGQTVDPETAMAEQDALTKKRFGNGDTTKVTIPYKLKGKPDKNGFQRIEVEGVDKGITHILNPLGDGYYVKK